MRAATINFVETPISRFFWCRTIVLLGLAKCLSWREMGAGRKEGVEEVVVLVPNIGVCPFCLDEISFRRNYKSCQIGVVVDVDVVPHLWKLCDGIIYVILELHFWDLVYCLLISFCFGSKILKKIGPPQPPKKPKNP